MEVLDTFEFTPNQVVVFVKTFNSWHSVRPMTGAGSPLMRKRPLVSSSSEVEEKAPRLASSSVGSTLFERMANLSRGGSSSDEAEEDEAKDEADTPSISIPRFLGRQNNQ